MIILKHLTLSGYKSIKHLDLDFGHINVLIGANGSGKSNLLSFFKLLKHLPGGDLQYHINKNEGGANNILYFGAKQTQLIDAKLEFEDILGYGYCYDFTLEYAAGDRFIFEKEQYELSKHVGRDNHEKSCVQFESGHSESQLHWNSAPREPGMHHLCELLGSFSSYHFNDTSLTAPIRQNTRFGNIAGKLKSGGDNLAHILHVQKQNAPHQYARIVECIQQIFPRFQEFVFEPNPEGIVQLKWRGEDPDYVFSAHQTPDGLLRAMALITLLQYSLEDKRPRIIIIDEPELGLHPHAVSIVAALMHLAAARCQVIIATQSVSMLDEFEAADVVVVDYDMDQRNSVFSRLDEKNYEDWLKRYSLSELWEKNVIGGGTYR